MSYLLFTIFIITLACPMSTSSLKNWYDVNEIAISSCLAAKRWFAATVGIAVAVVSCKQQQ